MNEKCQINENQVDCANADDEGLPALDELTNAYIKRYFQNFLGTEMLRSTRYSRSFSLCLIEVDCMKQYAETRGQEEADSLLSFLTDLLRTSVRATDLTCRYGDKGFIQLLPETSKKGAVTAAEKMRKVVQAYPFKGRDSQPKGLLTVSVGVSCFPEDGTDGDKLIEKGNTALHQATSSGGNKVCCSEIE